MSVRTKATSAVRTSDDVRTPLTARLYARVTEEELAVWRVRAGECKMIFSDWVRARLNGQPELSVGAPLPVAEIEDYIHFPGLSCGHPAEPEKPGKCTKWGCKNYVFAR